jgi:hypothetical protein
MSIYDTHKPSAGEGGGLYLKIQDGETVKLRLASEPAIFESESEREGKTVLTTRYGWLVWNQDANAAQILQQSATFFKSIAALAQDEEWGDPQGYDIKITRQGMALETTYNVMPSANRAPLSAEAQDAIKAIDLLEKLKASPFSQRVMWLSDFDKMSQAAKTESKARATEVGAAAPAQPAAKPDVVIEDIGDEPINLDDIPF